MLCVIIIQFLLTNNMHCVIYCYLSISLSLYDLSMLLLLLYFLLTVKYTLLFFHSYFQLFMIILSAVDPSALGMRRRGGRQAVGPRCFTGLHTQGSEVRIAGDHPGRKKKLTGWNKARCWGKYPNTKKYAGSAKQARGQNFRGAQFRQTAGGGGGSTAWGGQQLGGAQVGTLLGISSSHRGRAWDGGAFDGREQKKWGWGQDWWGKREPRNRGEQTPTFGYRKKHTQAGSRFKIAGEWAHIYRMYTLGVLEKRIKNRRAI